VIKLDPQAGLAIAPGVSDEVRVLVQVKMREIGIEMSYGMVDNVVQMAYHLVPISSMQSKGSSQCCIGKFTVKTNQPIDQQMQRMGPAILELMDNLILTRQLFDPTSVHTIDLQLVLGSIKKLKNRLLRVDDVWEALMTQFQCFHQLIQNWAKSSTTAVMPRLTGLDGMEAATLQWRRAEFAAAGYRTADPAWSPIQGIDGTSASAAAALGDGIRKHKGRFTISRCISITNYFATAGRVARPAPSEPSAPSTATCLRSTTCTRGRN
jgi:hypothetical protein